MPVGIARDQIKKRGGAAHAQIGGDALGGTRREKKASEANRSFGQLTHSLLSLMIR